MVFPNSFSIASASVYPIRNATNVPTFPNTACRDESLAREPSLQTALAYEAIYGRPVRELFAGLYEQIERDVAERAKVLSYRKDQKPNLKKGTLLASLVAKLTK